MLQFDWKLMKTKSTHLVLQRFLAGALLNAQVVVDENVSQFEEWLTGLLSGRTISIFQKFHCDSFHDLISERTFTHGQRAAHTLAYNRTHTRVSKVTLILVQVGWTAVRSNCVCWITTPQTSGTTMRTRRRINLSSGILHAHYIVDYEFDIKLYRRLMKFLHSLPSSLSPLHINTHTHVCFQSWMTFSCDTWLWQVMIFDFLSCQARWGTIGNGRHSSVEKLLFQDTSASVVQVVRQQPIHCHRVSCKFSVCSPISDSPRPSAVVTEPIECNRSPPTSKLN